MFQRVDDLGNRNPQIQSMVSECQGGSTIPGGIKNQTGKQQKLFGMEEILQQYILIVLENILKMHLMKR